MTSPNERSHDRPGDDLDRIRTRLIDDLTQAYRAAAPPPHLDSAVLQALRASVLDRDRSQTRAAWSRRLHLRPAARGARHAVLAAVAAALLLAMSGIVGALHAGGPTLVSAQTVLRRVAARQLAPNQAAHLVETVTVTLDGRTATGTADVWFQTDANGTPTLSVQDLTLDKGGKGGADRAVASSVPARHSRFIQIGSQLLAYNPELRGDNTIMLASRGQTRTHPSWVVPNEVFDGASVAQSLSALAQASPQQVRLLPQQTLDGHTVDVVEVDGWTQAPAQRTVFYFDAQSYVLRGFDATGLDPSYPMPSWQARFSAATTMAASAVPPQTFALAAPATARVALDLGGPAFGTAPCHFSATAKESLRSGHSLLSVCQATAPGVTAAALVAALAAPDKATLDAAVAAGVLTPAQAAVYLGQVQDQLTAYVTASTSPSAASATSPTQRK